MFRMGILHTRLRSKHSNRPTHTANSANVCVHVCWRCVCAHTRCVTASSRTSCSRIRNNDSSPKADRVFTGRIRLRPKFINNRRAYKCVHYTHNTTQTHLRTRMQFNPEIYAFAAVPRRVCSMSPWQPRVRVRQELCVFDALDYVPFSCRRCVAACALVCV